jgi:hypothetical protein
MNIWGYQWIWMINDCWSMIIIRDHTINDIGDDHSPWGIPFEKANSIGLPDLDIGSWIRKILYGHDGFVHAPK